MNKKRTLLKQLTAGILSAVFLFSFTACRQEAPSESAPASADEQQESLTSSDEGKLILDFYHARYEYTKITKQNY